MNKYIETLRLAAHRLENQIARHPEIPESYKDSCKDLRAIADRMEQQSKAEPVGFVSVDEFHGIGMNPLIPWEKIPVGTKLFTHPPADARDAEIYELFKIAYNSKFNFGAAWSLRAEAAIAAREGK